MMNVTRDMKMADVIHHNYLLLPVINRFGINLGFGEKTVEVICQQNGINLDFFLEITNSFIDDDYIPQRDLDSFPISLIIDYLKKTHNYYLDEKIPELEEMINRMVSFIPAEKSKALLIQNFFSEYRTELENHIMREEKKVQPYILEVEEAYLNEKQPAELIRKIKSYSMKDFAGEHDNVEEKLFDLKNIILKYMPPCADHALCNRILMELFRLEKDLNSHANLEDKVLIPKVADMENILLSKYAG
jgi:regulator of cell morphogenesis and NO signaling